MRVYKHSLGGPDAVALVARVRHGAKRSRADADGAPRVVLSGAAAAVPAPPPAAARPRHVLLRVQDQCMTSEIFGSVKCECKAQLDHSMSLIQTAAAGRWAAAGGASGVGDAGEDIVGLVVYLLQEGRGIGLAAKVAAYALQEDAGGGYGGGVEGLDTVDANRALALPDDAREYDAVRDILHDLGVGQGGEGAPLYVLTNNRRKVEALEALGVVVAGRLPCAVEPPSPLAARYMRAKVERMGHILP
jgi:GTP cyclohydrolase II